MAGNKYVRDALALALIVEASSGTFLAPTAVLPMERGAGSPEPKLETDVSDPASSYKGSKKTTIITDFATVEYGAKLKLPSAHALVTPAFAMCGVVGTAFTGGVSYAFSSNNEDTCSMQFTEQRTITKVRGAKSGFELTAEVGKAVEVNFNTIGHLEAVEELGSADADNVIPATPDFSSVFMTSNCSAYLVNGASAHFTKVAFKLGATNATIKETCAISAFNVDVEPKLTVSMSLTEENEASFNDLKNGTEFNFVIPFYDIAGVKKYELIAPKCVAVEQKKSETDRKMNVEKTLECRQTSGDDAWELKAFD